MGCFLLLGKFCLFLLVLANLRWYVFNFLHQLIKVYLILVIQIYIKVLIVQDYVFLRLYISHVLPQLAIPVMIFL